MAANWPTPEVTVGSRMTATRFTFGAASLSSCGHFPLNAYSYATKPVVLPPGRARLATNPAPTGSTTAANTIGTLWLACCNPTPPGEGAGRRAAGPNPTSPPAYLGQKAG